MRGDNAKTVNPEPKAQRVRRRRARVENAVSLLDIQLGEAKSGSYAKRVDALRRALATILLCVPQELSREKRDDFAKAFLQSVYNDEDEFYDMPNVSIDGDLISVHGNFSLSKLAKKFQW
jgi:hypothetical protein